MDGNADGNGVCAHNPSAPDSPRPLRARCHRWCVRRSGVSVDIASDRDRRMTEQIGDRLDTDAGWFF